MKNFIVKLDVELVMSGSNEEDISNKLSQALTNLGVEDKDVKIINFGIMED